MSYDCQSCNYKFNASALSEDTMGELQCPECGSFDLLEVHTDEEAELVGEDVGYILDNYDPNVFYGL